MQYDRTTIKHLGEYNLDKVKKPFYKKWWFITIVAFFVIGMIGSALESDESKQKRKNEELALEQKKEDEKAKKIEVAAMKDKEEKQKEDSMSLDEKVIKIVNDKLGQTNNAKKDTIVESKVFEQGDETHNIILTLNASENLTNDMTRRSMWIDSISILEPLSKIEGTENIVIEWLYPLQDQYGNIEDKRIMMMNVSKEVRDKINWENFDVENLQNIAGEYFEHPALSN